MGSTCKLFLGKYRGVVTNNADLSGLGRLKARVPDVMGDIETVWAMPCVVTVDCLPVPAVGAGVWIEFERGDPDFPIWSGFWWSSPDDMPPIVEIPRTSS